MWTGIPPESHIMRAREAAAARLCRAGIVAPVLGVGAFVLPTTEIRRRATAQLSKDRPSLIMTPDREFAASSFVHEQLRSSVPRDAHSDAWVADLQRQISGYYGVVSVNIDRYSPPLYVVAIDQPTVRVRAERASDPAWTFEPLQQQWQSVPLPDGFQPSAGIDKEAIVYQPSTRRRMREQASTRFHPHQRSSLFDARFYEESASCLSRARAAIHPPPALACRH